MVRNSYHFFLESGVYSSPSSIVSISVDFATEADSCEKTLRHNFLRCVLRHVNLEEAITKIELVR